MSASVRLASSATFLESAIAEDPPTRLTCTDRSSFGPIYHQFAPEIYRYCFRCLKSREDAEDATSQAFMQAFANFHRLRDDNIRPWLFRIAHNVVIDMTRKLRHAEPFDEVIDSPAAQLLTEAEVELHELQVVLAGALASLSERDQQLVQLRLAGLTAVEIAAVLECSAGAVRIAHHRALEKLRNVLMEQGHNAGQIS